ncbi:MAG TPA: hypothetical protein VHB70_05590 [Parafilimonas sp.]|nr:hypothetical protein [Parafilimonas sp.]
MPTRKNEGDFHVSLNGIQLSEDARNRIQAAIQKAVMNELAAYYPNPDDDYNSRAPFNNGVILLHPRWWWGFILRPILDNEIDNLEGLAKTINAEKYAM